MRVAQPTLHEAVSSLGIDAPREAVWHNVVSFSELPAPPEWFFRQGVAYPMRAHIAGEGVGAALLRVLDGTLLSSPSHAGSRRCGYRLTCGHCRHR